MMQGLSVGGECTTSWVFLFESAPPGRRGLTGGFAELRRCGGILLGSVTGCADRECPADRGHGEHGPGASRSSSGCWSGSSAISCAGLIRRSGEDRSQTRSPLVETVRDHRPLLLWLGGLTVFGAVGFYLMFLYIVSWLQFADGISPAHALEINTVSMVVLIPVILLASGWLSRSGSAESRSCCLPCSWACSARFRCCA